ncbi:MAG TPA: metallophosphoesterase family protein [Candidatus Cybelea sp.]|nr:metallophosphoesterase family protein [Candidatus Cybelea sp.]
MRIAVLSDIHGNLLALDACLADLEAQGGADAVIVAGDLCLPGPKPKKVLQRLEELGAACIRGNKDRFLCDGASDGEHSAADVARIDWTRRELGERWLSWLRDLPFAMRIGEDDNQLLIVHANPKNDEEHIWPDADEATLERLVGDERATTIAFGHLHLPYVRMWRGRLLVNVASAGVPKDGDPRACYAILTERAGGWEVKHRRVTFDVKKVATQLSDCGIPESAELIATLRRHRYKQLKKLIP